MKDRLGATGSLSNSEQEQRSGKQTPWSPIITPILLRTSAQAPPGPGIISALLITLSGSSPRHVPLIPGIFNPPVLPRPSPFPSALQRAQESPALLSCSTTESETAPRRAKDSWSLGAFGGIR